MAEMALKDVPSMRVAALRKQGPVSEIGQSFGELFGHLMRLRAPLGGGPPIGVYYAGEDFDPAHCVYEVCAPLGGPLGTASPLAIKDLPAIQAACAVHKGPYNAVGAVYSDVFEWIASQGLEPAGPVREVYVVGPAPDGSRPAGDFVTEIQVPVARR
jgi:effector-binding domain-containing protein